MRLFRNVGIIRLHRREYLSHTGQFNRRRSAVSALTPASPPSLNPRFSGWAKRIMRRVAWPIASSVILNLLTASRSYVRRLLSPRMKTTRYFREQVLRKRPYIRLEWCERILAQPLAKMVQSDGRIRFWGTVPELGGRVLRVVTLADGETLHNAFPDRDFKVTAPQAG